MAITAFKNFIGGYNVAISPQIAYERTINMYVVDNLRTPEQIGFASLPGLNFEKTINQQQGRPLGLYSYRNLTSQDLYQVVGDSFYRNDEFIGYVNSTHSPIWWSATSTQVTFTDGANLYSYDFTTGVYTVVNAPFIINPGVITAINGRIIVPLLNTNEWYASAINDATSYDSNRFALFNLIPDVLMGSASVNSRLLLIGQIHTESWFPVASAGIPLNRDNNVTINYGTWASSSILSVTEKDGSVAVYWLGRDQGGGAFFAKSNGTNDERFSTTEIDILLQTLQLNFGISDCYGWYMRINGHLLIYWNFPSANVTLVYDENTNLWFEANMLDGSYFIINAHAFVNGIHYGTSRLDGSLYSISNKYTQYYTIGNTPENIHRTRIGPRIRAEEHVRFEFTYFEIKFEQGTAPVGITPNVWLQTAIDDNYYSNSIPMPMGETGQYFQKVFWRALGQGYDILPRIDIYDPIEFYVIGASYTLMKGIQ
jgi:hypothetical protein